jgi:hypothetical protein
LNIHQNQIEALVFERRKSFVAVVYDNDLVSPLTNQPLREDLIDGVVLNQENLQLTLRYPSGQPRGVQDPELESPSRG